MQPRTQRQKEILDYIQRFIERHTNRSCQIERTHARVRHRDFQTSLPIGPQQFLRRSARGFDAKGRREKATIRGCRRGMQMIRRSRPCTA